MGPFNPLSGGPGAFGGGGADLNETSAGAVADSESDTENWSPVSNASGRGSAGKTIVLLVICCDIALIILICLYSLKHFRANGAQLPKTGIFTIFPKISSKMKQDYLYQVKNCKTSGQKCPNFGAKEPNFKNRRFIVCKSSEIR